MAHVYVSIGSNIDKEINIPSSINELEKQYGPLEISNIYETKAVGFEGDDFYNLVVGFQSNDSPNEISQKLKEIELNHDRTRGKEQFDSRTLDLDQLLYDDLVMHMDSVNIPHSDILRYNFVLKPLAEIAGDVMHPEEHKSIHELWCAAEKNGEMRIVNFEFNQCK